MQLIHAFPIAGQASGLGRRVLLVSGQPAALRQRLQALGADVVTCNEFYTALSGVLDDPGEAEMLVIECDTIPSGGPEAMRRALGVLVNSGRALPVILVSGDFRQQSFPEDRLSPIELRAPVSAVSLKVGFEHALRDRVEGILA